MDVKVIDLSAAGFPDVRPGEVVKMKGEPNQLYKVSASNVGTGFQFSAMTDEEVADYENNR